MIGLGSDRAAGADLHFLLSLARRRRISGPEQAQRRLELREQPLDFLTFVRSGIALQPLQEGPLARKQLCHGRHRTSQRFGTHKRFGAPPTSLLVLAAILLYPDQTER